MKPPKTTLNYFVKHQHSLGQQIKPPNSWTTETISPARSIPQTYPSKSEIGSAIKSLPFGKAARIDGIPAEFYKSNPYMAAEVLQPILEEAWLSEALPEERTDGIIVKIPKKG